MTVVSPNAAGMRADSGISRLCPELSRRQIQGLCERGRVFAEGRRLAKSDRLRLGDQITVLVDSRPIATANPAGQLLVRFESRQWVIVAKPAGRPTAPKDSTEIDTLANALVAKYPELARIGHRALEPGLLHRLDNGTSGLVVAARTAEGFHAASNALSRGKWLKRYLAVVEGTGLPPAGVLEGQLAADRRHRGRGLGCQRHGSALSRTTRSNRFPPNPLLGPSSMALRHGRRGGHRCGLPSPDPRPLCGCGLAARQ